MKSGCLIIFVGAVVALTVGCGTYTTALAPGPQLTEDQANFEAIWRATQNVLTDYYFQIDRRDRRAGLVSTYPMTGQYVTEFWRKDSVNLDNLTESLLQTIRRQASVRIVSDLEAPQGYSASVEVESWRSNRPQKQLTSTSQGYSLFTIAGNIAVMDTKVQLGNYDVSIGRDEALENRIASAIEVETTRILTKR